MAATDIWQYGSGAETGSIFKAGTLPRRSGNVTGDSGVVTTDSGRSHKSVTIDQNERS
jgi:hypothetical protein